VLDGAITPSKNNDNKRMSMRGRASREIEGVR
jgi:hypothetical protein